MTKARVWGWVMLGAGTVAAVAQDPLVTLPKNYKAVLDNASVTVIRAHYGAHEKIPVHDHTAFSTVFVYLSDSGPVQISHIENGKVDMVVRPPTVKGSYRVAAGIAERHSIENPGEMSSDFLRVELKKVSLDLKEPFRGKAPASLATSQDAVEFSAPGLEVERIVCAGAHVCPMNASGSDSVLVAFTPVTLGKGLGASERLEAGAVRWVKASDRVTIGGEGTGPGHVLRIALPTNGR